MFPKYFYKILFYLFFIIFILLSVAFFTLLERKIMSVNHLRLGPNKLFFFGIIQPVIDGFKLFLKQLNNSNLSYYLFFFSPAISFIISFSIWSIFFFESLKFKLFFILIFMGVSIYSFVISGWSSFSKFAFLGGMRASSQTVSYEISLTILLLISIMFFQSYKFNFFFEFFFFFFFPIFFLWLVTMIAETNRAPFDFSEGESELISGFNIEYGSSGFILFFLAEYSMMIFFSFFIMKLMNFNFFFFFFLLFFFILTRTSFPRFRYDFLVSFMWFKILPFVSFILMIFIFL